MQCVTLMLGLQEDKENFCNSVRTELKATGLLDTTDNCWDFFIDKVPARSRVLPLSKTATSCMSLLAREPLMCRLVSNAAQTRSAGQATYP